MFQSLTAAILVLIFWTSLAGASSRTAICGPYFLEDSDTAELSLSKNEKILICGTSSPGWSDIPRWQALRQIEILLQAQGYYTSSHRQVGNKTLIIPGPQTKIASLDFQNAPKRFLSRTFLGVENKALTRENLDEIESWTFRRLRNLGYPCPKIAVTASAASGVVTIKSKTGRRVKVKAIQRDVVPGVESEALSRFDAFQLGDYYNENNFSLTSRRLKASGVVDHSDFSSPCGPEDTSDSRTFRQRLSFAKPKRLQLAIGASTEQFPILKAAWKNSRLDSKGSQVSTRVELSPVAQTLTADSHWHPLLDWPRFYLLPEVEVERLSETFYTTIVQKFSNGIGLMLDDSKRYYGLEFKPTYNFEKTVKGEGPDNNRYLSFETSLLTLSHDFEYYLQSPRSGYNVSLNWRNRNQGLESFISSNRYQLKGTYLLNWGGFDPPIVILGFRYSLALLYASEIAQTSLGNRLFLGGDNDMRGFARKSINNGGVGFGSSVYFGSEIRLVRVLPYKLQPFLFVDFAKVGLRVESLDDANFYAPGLGMRWQSPFGALRATVARGLVGNRQTSSIHPRDQWTVFLSYGKEF